MDKICRNYIKFPGELDTDRIIDDYGDNEIFKTITDILSEMNLNPEGDMVVICVLISQIITRLREKDVKI